MYKAQFKSTAYGVWQTIGSYTVEGQAILLAQRKKDGGAFAARVVDRSGSVIYSC